MANQTLQQARRMLEELEGVAPGPLAPDENPNSQTQPADLRYD
ncbi:hypothetical protein [Tritonibacter scottomollicae]